VLTSPDGAVTTGEFKDGAAWGKGSTVYANGDRYVGEYRDGYRNGVGVLVYANGDTYEGGFKDDEFDGYGRYTFADSGEVEEGQWQQGELASGGDDDGEFPQTSTGPVNL
jgi:hypothetical protein